MRWITVLLDTAGAGALTAAAWLAAGAPAGLATLGVALLAASLNLTRSAPSKPHPERKP